MKTAQKHNNTQAFTEISVIKNGVVFFTSGNACLIIGVKTTNFALLSEAEQQGKIRAYASLLNSLSFPIQVFIHNKKLNFSSYIRSLEQQEQQSINPKLKEMISNYKLFVQNLITTNEVLDKKFYISIPFSYSDAGMLRAPKNSGQEQVFVQKTTEGLGIRAKSLIDEIARVGLVAKILGNNELVQLFYDVYNQSVSGTSVVAEKQHVPFVKTNSNNV